MLCIDQPLPSPRQPRAATTVVVPLLLLCFATIRTPTEIRCCALVLFTEQTAPRRSSVCLLIRAAGRLSSGLHKSTKSVDLIDYSQGCTNSQIPFVCREMVDATAAIYVADRYVSLRGQLPKAPKFPGSILSDQYRTYCRTARVRTGDVKLAQGA